MNIHFKIRCDLLDSIHADLARPHAFAHERVGFISAGLTRIGGGSLIVLAQSYAPVADEDYLQDPTVGAMMGSEAIRKALQLSYRARTAAIHVHCHGHLGRPAFSGVDIRENGKFVPNFFNVASHAPQGAIVLSLDRAAGNLWLGRDESPCPISRFTVVGAPTQMDGATR